MNRKFIIKKKSEIDLFFQKGIRVGNSYFTIYKKESIANVNFRFAMSIGRKFGNAVARNKMKRQIRSIVRENQTLIKGCEFVIVVKPKANLLKFREINNNLVYLFRKINIMENKDEKIQ